MTWLAVMLLATGPAAADRTAIPAPVAAAARAIARDSARPPSLRRPMLGVRRERFAAGWVWIVDGGRMDDSSLCGTGGCIVQLWIARARGGVVRRFNDRVIHYEIAGRTSRQPVLRTEYHGSHCGGSGNMPCVVTYRWTPDAARPPGRFAKGIVRSS